MRVQAVRKRRCADAKDKTLRKVLPRGSNRLASAVFAWYNSADFWYLNMLRAHLRPRSLRLRQIFDFLAAESRRSLRPECPWQLPLMSVHFHTAPEGELSLLRRSLSPVASRFVRQTKISAVKPGYPQI